MTGTAGEFFFENSATGIGIDQIQDPTELHIRWFDHWLKDKPLAIEKPVHLYKMRQKTWDALESFPPSDNEEHFYLESAGHAASLYGDGRLVREPSDKNTS